MPLSAGESKQYMKDSRRKGRDGICGGHLPIMSATDIFVKRTSRESFFLIKKFGQQNIC
jgi:hypothetical protein